MPDEWVSAHGTGGTQSVKAEKVSSGFVLNVSLTWVFAALVMANLTSSYCQLSVARSLKTEHWQLETILVEAGGLEPPIPGCDPGVIPLNYAPIPAAPNSKF